MLENLFPKHIYYIRRLFLSYHLPGKSLASTENKNQRHKNAKSNARISKHIKLHEYLPHAPQSQFLVLYFNYYRLAIGTLEVQICLKVLNHGIAKKLFPRMLKMCSIADE